MFCPVLCLQNKGDHNKEGGVGESVCVWEPGGDVVKGVGEWARGRVLGEGV